MLVTSLFSGLRTKRKAIKITLRKTINLSRNKHFNIWTNHGQSTRDNKTFEIQYSEYSRPPNLYLLRLLEQQHRQPQQLQRRSSAAQKAVIHTQLPGAHRPVPYSEYIHDDNDDDSFVILPWMYELSQAETWRFVLPRVR